MKFFFRYLKYYKKETVIAPLFKLLEACFDLLVPVVVAYMIDNGIEKDDKRVVINGFILLCAFAIVGLSCTLIAQYFSAKAAVGCATRVRRDLFEHIQKYSYSQTDKAGTSTLITRMTSDVNQFQSGINMTLRLLLRSPIIVFGAVIMAFTVNPELAIIFAVIVPLLSVVVFTIICVSMPLYKKIQKKLDNVTGKTRANLNGVRVVRAFRLEDREISSFDQSNKAHTALQKLAGGINALMNPMTYVLVNAGVILIIKFGGDSAVNSGAQKGEIIALVNYMSQILVELIKLANTIFTVSKAAACANRLCEVLDTPAGVDIYEDDTSSASDAVSFENVSLSYDNAPNPAIRNIDFSIPSGSCIGIIGGTGSGKSTLVNMIPRFYDATEGDVRVFGRSVKSYKHDELIKKIGIVPQNAVLFRGSVRSNLLWGNKSATDGELWHALEIAQAADFVRELPDGLDSVVEQGGKNFSGGQKQRLTIARAIVKDPKILILDDSASALDLATGAALNKALKTLPDVTTIIISQRTSAVMHADNILVLEDGAVCGIGDHAQLLDNCPTYREIYDSQFKGGDAV